jgi:peptidoglycan/xylan/chitin deacetylase (PgdA/CDA1 family)
VPASASPSPHPTSRERPWFRGGLRLLVVVAVAAALLPVPAPSPASASPGAASTAPFVNGCPRPVAGLRTEHDGARSTVALTFDDGPHPVYTPAVLDELDRLGVKATFFVVGERVERHPQLARSIVERGHAIANHTYTHPMSPSMDELPLGVRADQVDRATSAIVRATGVRPCAYRSPGSKHRSVETQRLVNQRDLRVVHWTHNAYDSRFTSEDDRARAVQTIVARVTSPILERPVVLLHDGGGVTADRSLTVAAIEPVVRAYRARGYGFVDAAGAPFRRVEPALLTACGVPSQTQGGFRDVAPTATHAPGILCARRWGVVAGRTATTFVPDAPVTRAQVATMLHGLLREVGSPLPATRTRFRDVEGSVHREAIEVLASAGIVLGRTDGTFRPGDPVRRDQLASMLLRAVEAVAGPRPDGAVRFTDVPADSVHAAAIGRLAAAGVVRGIDARSFAPEASVTRAQVATFTMRSAALLVREGHGHTR